MAVCAKCGNSDPAEFYTPSKPSSCKPCTRIAQRERYVKMRAADPERLREWGRQWKARNREAVRAAGRAYAAEHAAENRERGRAWYEANRERHNANTVRWREANREHVRELDRQAYWANPEKVRERKRADMLKRRVGRDPLSVEYADVLRTDPCSYCGESGGAVDHIVPVASGGGNEWENLTGACRRCNSGKHDRPLLAFMGRR